MECVNRKHVCPCCNADATKAQLVRNHWFDKMLAIVQQEKEEAAKKYFSKLVASSGNSSLTFILHSHHRVLLQLSAVHI